ncbi:MAG: trmB [Rickettsiales bacterium]|jgi:tRNA (guanine-N7-)-methyltransferase|nr:trmB [Rickettsiales bacterium]
MPSDTKLSPFADIPWIKSFARRKGRGFSARQEVLMESLWPDVVIAPIPEGLKLQGVKDGDTEKDAPCFKKPSSFFPHNPDKIWLEIGFGGGEHLAGLAERDRSIGFIGCEPYVLGAAVLLEHIEEKRLENVRIWSDDARFLIEKLPNASLDRAFILFPDPWRKTRHYKRRIVSDATLSMLARVLREGAELRLATDHADYADWMREHLERHPDFSWVPGEEGGSTTPPPDWVVTRYQEKAALEGRESVFFRVVRVAQK